MKKSIVCLLVGLAMGVAWAEGLTRTVEGLSVGPVAVKAVAPGAWAFTTEAAKLDDGREELKIRLAAPEAAVPPRFTVDFMVPQIDAHHRWTADQERVTMPPDWGAGTGSRLCSGLPLIAFVNDTDLNRMLVAASEARRQVSMLAGLNEEKCALKWRLTFFTEPEAPIKDYEVRLLIDRREVFFGDAIREGVAWIEATAGLTPCAPPPDAFAPLYSAWYSFHQNVSDREIEAECAEAAKLGMKVVIVDDGWQTDDTNRGYRFTGDWEISKRRFPNMAEHVAKVHAMGMKYMIWYGVPMMGLKAKNYDRFKGKYLYINHGSGYACMDPRFPEVRDYICGLYERAMREWKLDGLKLDFIDSFGFRGEDPAVKENYAGRDIKALPEAVDRLLADIRARITAIKPDALIEYRQSYIGPAIRQYGNMMRAADCPGDLLANRARTANLRLTSGKSAVHADMLEWNAADTPENAARFVLSTMFSVIQYSMMLRELPADHKRMVAHWIDFSRRHEEALLHGGFRPHHFEAFYPWIEGWNDTERIVGVYTEGTVVPVDATKKTNYILNATGTKRVLLENAAPCQAEIFDTYGARVGSRELPAGIVAVEMPVSGYLRLTAAFRCEYTEACKAIPRLRGVMSPAVWRLTRQDVLDLRAWGANVMRWQFDCPREKLERGVAAYQDWLTDRLAHLETLLPDFEAGGIKVVIDMHTPPGGKGKDAFKMFSDEVLYELYLKNWETIAKRFKDNETVVAYDLINEPNEHPSTMVDYWRVQEEAARRIRRIDPEKPVIVTVARWGKPAAFETLKPIAFKNVFYTCHMYEPMAFTHQGTSDNFAKQRKGEFVSYPSGEWNRDWLREQLRHARAFQLKYGARIYIGEVGVIRCAPGAAQWLDDAISIFEEYGWDWSFHAYREWINWSAEHSANLDDTAPCAAPTDRLKVLKKWLRRNSDCCGGMGGCGRIVL